jgi:hypothetical protein
VENPQTSKEGIRSRERAILPFDTIVGPNATIAELFDFASCCVKRLLLFETKNGREIHPVYIKIVEASKADLERRKSAGQLMELWLDVVYLKEPFSLFRHLPPVNRTTPILDLLRPDLLAYGVFGPEWTKEEEARLMAERVSYDSALYIAWRQIPWWRRMWVWTPVGIEATTTFKEEREWQTTMLEQTKT